MPDDEFEAKAADRAGRGEGTLLPGSPTAPDTSQNQPADSQGADAQADQFYSIGALSAEFGLTTRTIRFYESKALISPRREGSRRLYTRRDRARLKLILRGKNLGFSLEEIREFLDLYDADPSLLMQTRHLLGKVETAIADLEKKRADIDRSLAELTQIRDLCVDHLNKAQQ